MRFLFLLLLFVFSAFGTEKTLKIYAWSNYISSDVLKDFALKYDAKVRYEIYYDPQDVYKKIKDGNKEQYDILIIPSFFVSKMSLESLLVPLDKAKLPNIKNLDSSFLNQSYDAGNKYSLPYLWGTTSILYDSSKIKIERYTDLWNPKLKNSILANNEMTEMYCIALKSLGFNIATTNPAEIEKATQQLLKLIPNIKAISSEDVPKYFLRENFVVGIAYNGDGYAVTQKNKAYRYIYPKEGPSKWIDNLVMPRGSKNSELTYQFLDFVLSADGASKNAESAGYATPNAKALPLISKENRTNDAIYPKGIGIEKIEIAKYNPQTVELFEKGWKKFLVELENSRKAKK
jgi:spermidine/putrescine transport system substrate-binding protein